MWCGAVWCVAWRVVWCGVVWRGVGWCGVVWCVVWCGVVWCGAESEEDESEPARACKESASKTMATGKRIETTKPTREGTMARTVLRAFVPRRLQKGTSEEEIKKKCCCAYGSYNNHLVRLMCRCCGRARVDIFNRRRNVRTNQTHQKKHVKTKTEVLHSSVAWPPNL